MSSGTAGSPTRREDTPPSSPSDSLRGGSKVMAVNVLYLDDTVQTFQIQAKACGRVLFDQACKVLNLLEVDYFGLEYSDDKATKFWLDYEKPVYKQLSSLARDSSSPLLSFSVKFYTPDPAQLEEEFTRYLFSLQVKRDLAKGYLHCNDQATAILASYIVQSECGDYSKEDYPDHTYLSSYKFVPHQTPELEKMIMENHKKHVGQSPTEADLNLLETARRCELYGLRLTPAKDLEGVALNLAVAHMGVLVFQNHTKITTFSWAKIRKLSFKRKRFLIKLHPEGYYKDTVEYVFDSRNNSKNFWKRCIENHAFFRCSEVRRHPRLKKRIFSRGSSFRYSGRTQKQVVEFIRDNYTKRQPFQRSTSLRISSTSSSRQQQHRRGEEYVAAQPLLPGSQSCGSVALCPQTPSPARERPISQSEPSSPHLTNGNIPATTAAAISSGLTLTLLEGILSISEPFRASQLLNQPCSKSKAPLVVEENFGEIGSSGGEDISYVLRRRDSSHADESPIMEVERPCLGQPSLLYSRGSHLKEGSKPSSDFVSIFQLPGTLSFSSRDDTLDEGSLEKEIFDYLRKKMALMEQEEAEHHQQVDSLQERLEAGPPLPGTTVPEVSVQTGGQALPIQDSQCDEEVVPETKPIIEISTRFNLPDIYKPQPIVSYTLVEEEEDEEQSEQEQPAEKTVLPRPQDLSLCPREALNCQESTISPPRHYNYHSYKFMQSGSRDEQDEDPAPPSVIHRKPSCTLTFTV